jgi:tRNA uridine 5-carboxymethylaminomethyl modification enzyme
MFTSRAEDRLFLRHDNADQRLTDRAFRAGLVTNDRYARFQTKMRFIEEARAIAIATKLRGVPISQLFRRPDFGVQDLPSENFCCVPAAIWKLVETDFKYEGYAVRQSEQNRKLESHQEQVIPDGLDYSKINGLRSETRQKLTSFRPTSLGQAARISGITPADVVIISIWLSKNYLHQDTAK